MNLIIDTNIWLDLVVFKDPRVGQLREDLEAGHVLCHRTGHMMAELQDVLSRPLFKLDAAAQALALQDALALSRQAAVPDNPARPMICRDPDDQVFLDLALALPAQVILSKDKALLRLASKARKYNLIIAEKWPLKTSPQTSQPQAAPQVALCTPDKTLV